MWVVWFGSPTYFNLRKSRQCVATYGNSNCFDFSMVLTVNRPLSFESYYKTTTTSQLLKHAISIDQVERGAIRIVKKWGRQRRQLNFLVQKPFEVGVSGTITLEIADFGTFLWSGPLCTKVSVPGSGFEVREIQLSNPPGDCLLRD